MTVTPHLTRLARHSAVYGLGDFVARFLGVLLLPLYTAYLTPTDYGQIELLVAHRKVDEPMVALSDADHRHGVPRGALPRRSRRR